MEYFDLASLGSSAQKAATVGSGSGIFSLFFGYKNKKGLTRAQRKKLAMRRYRTFVDNIVMHHKRIHDRNREIAVGQISKPKAIKLKDQPTLSPSLNRDSHKWRDKFNPRDHSVIIRGRIDARRLRARSRWVSITSHAQSLQKAR